MHDQGHSEGGQRSECESDCGGGHVTECTREPLECNKIRNTLGGTPPPGVARSGGNAEEPSYASHTRSGIYHPRNRRSVRTRRSHPVTAFDRTRKTASETDKKGQIIA